MLGLILLIKRMTMGQIFKVSMLLEIQIPLAMQV